MIKWGDSMNYVKAKQHTRGTISPPRRKKKKDPSMPNLCPIMVDPTLAKMPLVYGLSIAGRHAYAHVPTPNRCPVSVRYQWCLKSAGPFQNGEVLRGRQGPMMLTS